MLNIKNFLRKRREKKLDVIKGLQYNKKGFISTEEDNSSMSAFHAKVFDEHLILRLHDCHTSIRFRNSAHSKSEVKLFINKMRNLANVADDFADYLESELDKD